MKYLSVMIKNNYNEETTLHSTICEEIKKIVGNITPVFENFSNDSQTGVSESTGKKEPKNYSDLEFSLLCLKDYIKVKNAANILDKTKCR